MAIHELIIVALVAAIAWAAVSDAMWFRIPNVVPALILVLFPLHAVLTGMALPDAGWSGLVAVSTFTGGFVLFARGAMGGGDVKLLTALSLWAGPAHILSFLVITALAGGVLALVAINAYRFAPVWSRAMQLRLSLRLPPAPTAGKGSRTIPYGIAIAIGGLLLCRQLALQAGT